MIDWSQKKTAEQVAEEARLERVPHFVTMKQARLAMLHSGILSDVEAKISLLPGDDGEAVRIEWEYSQEVRRVSAIAETIETAAGLDQRQIDDLFLFAATIP